MTGGLDQPDEFEVKQGALALMLPGTPHEQPDWEAAAATVLRKAHRLVDKDEDAVAWRALASQTLDGLEIAPLGTAAVLDHLNAPVRPTEPGGRDVRVQVVGADVAALNAEALTDLKGGATSLWVGGDGATNGDSLDLPRILEGVLLDLAPVVLDVPAAHLAAAEALIELIGEATPAPGANLGMPSTASDEDLVAAAALAGGNGLLAVVVDATAIHDQGGSDVQELAWSMWSAARVLRVLTESGLDVGGAATLVEFRYAVTDEQFVSIAKLRAARQLWSRVQVLSGAEPVAQRQHAVTSRPMLSKYDPHVNLVRNTVAAFAASAGGADAVTVVPFDSPLGRSEAFGRRIARNVGAILDAESHVGRVADPAGGAFAVETLTQQLASAAWSLFGELEAGQPIEELIGQTVRERDAAVATRQRPITGLSEFPHLDESPPPRSGDPDDVRRYGAEFEAMRDHPPTNRVFLATLGAVAAHTARAGFAANLLAAGGIGVDQAGPTDGVEDLVAAYAEQQVVCLASTDAAYAEWGADVAVALRKAGAKHVILAGPPADWADDSCAAGVDAVAFLRRTREALT